MGPLRAFLSSDLNVFSFGFWSNGGNLEWLSTEYTFLFFSFQDVGLLPSTSTCSDKLAWRSSLSLGTLQGPSLPFMWVQHAVEHLQFNIWSNEEWMMMALFFSFFLFFQLFWVADEFGYRRHPRRTGLWVLRKQKRTALHSPNQYICPWEGWQRTKNKSLVWSCCRLPWVQNRMES